MSLAYWEPTTVAEALRLLRELGDSATVWAGGTDLGVLMRRAKIHPAQVISLAGLPELSGLAVAGGEVVVGAGTAHREIEASPVFRGPLQALPEACATVGSVQIRNMGTVGGNLCNASPAADTPPVLLALGASVTIAGAEGTRQIPLEQFFRGYRQTAVARGELLVDVRIPVPPPGTGSAFLKMGRRKAMEISIACVGALVTLDAARQICQEVRIGLGSVAPTSIRAYEAEEVLRGKAPTPDRIAWAAAVAAARCSPIDDLRASAEYRQMVTETLVTRALGLAAQRAGQTTVGQEGGGGVE